MSILEVTMGGPNRAGPHILRAVPEDDDSLSSQEDAAAIEEWLRKALPGTTFFDLAETLKDVCNSSAFHAVRDLQREARAHFAAQKPAEAAP